ncbi:caspase-3-like [Pristis pectinata]|uniref:caspase-3-like n=1 Tax=Pristis pectinata TaxID=685728 RepID=UPI00223E461C|nr:caspase-3-like [Pristis pectinata]
MAERRAGVKARALIVSVGKFHSPSGLGHRKGAETDTKRLHHVLYKLGFEVVIRMDITARDILREYRRESRQNHGPSFVSIVSSHGEDGVIYGADGEPVHLRDIYSMFTEKNCPSLAGKPKIFFIQACRGGNLDDGVCVEQIETDSCSAQQDFFSHYLAIPDDTAVHFSSCPGYCSFLRPSGSAFLQTLCELLSGEQRHWELLRIMTHVNCRVALMFESRGRYGGKKQMPCFISKLQEEVYPFSDRPAAEREPSSP